jgi:hypothetical protein
VNGLAEPVDLPRRSWTHVGRVWTNGEPFLLLDVSLLSRGGAMTISSPN